MKPKNKEPIESFAPELKVLLLQVARTEKPVTLDFPTAKMAHVFRRRLHTLRQRMREELPDEYKVVCRAEVGAVTQEQGQEGRLKPAKVTIRLKDSEYQAILSKANITAPAMEADPLEDFPAVTDEELKA